jgi:hypothetical protein
LGIRGDDEVQTYLLGLKFFTTGDWPFFGPDVVVPGSQIPGALQGLLVGLPFLVLPIPAAPYIFLNLLSLAGLCLLAWYCGRRCPDMPSWFTWTWLLAAPWTLNVSTQILNTSYLLFAAVLFFIAALETYPSLALNVIKPRVAFAMMGLSFFCICQLHLSWILLVPFLTFSFWSQAKTSLTRLRDCLLSFAAGALISGSLLIPTLFFYGFQSTQHLESTVQFNPANLTKIIHILGRFLSFASYELPRFMGWGVNEQLSFLGQFPWVIPFVVLAGILGLLQPLILLVCWFNRSNTHREWKALKWLVLWTVILIYASFLFSGRGPKSHTFYVTLPVSMIYSFYCWEYLFRKAIWRKLGIAFLFAAMIVNIALALNNYSRGNYSRNRALINRAIAEKNYKLLGERRPGSYY